MTDQLPAAFSRRSAIKLAAASAAMFGLGGLSACATGGGGGTTETTGPAGETSADNPLGVDKKAPLDYVIFNGGYGDQYGAEHVKLYNAWAGAEVAKMTSTVKIGSTLQPRFAGGNPPDVIDNSGADQMPTATLAGQKQLADLKPLLEAPTVDDPNVKIADVLLPGAIESGSFDGVFHVMNYVFSMWGFWNSSSLFSEKGWEPAKTWDDFMALSDKIKGTGLAPVHPHRRAHPVHGCGDHHHGRAARRHRHLEEGRQPRARRLDQRLDAGLGQGLGGVRARRATSSRAPKASTTPPRRPSGCSARPRSSRSGPGWRTR